MTPVDPSGQAGPAQRAVAGTPPGQSLPRLLLGIAVAVLVVLVGVTHRAAVDAGSDSLAAADREWLLLAGAATGALWVMGTVTQLGAMPLRPPFGRLLAVQAAASFVNHLLPAGSGGIGVNIRFLRRHGLDSAAAASATGLNALAGLLTHVLLLAVAVTVSPRIAGQVHPPAAWHLSWSVASAAAPWLAAGTGAAVCVAAGLLRWRAGSWRGMGRWLARAGARARHEAGRIGAVLRDPYRAVALWLGSLATPLLHGLILFAVARSLGVPLSAGAAVVVYLVVSSISAVIPSPGGIGALDVALVTGLVALGISSTTALAVVLGYRLITVWVPFLPGALAFAVLLRRRII